MAGQSTQELSGGFHFFLRRFALIFLNISSSPFRSSQQPDKLCRKNCSKVPAREEKRMNCIVEFLITLFEVIQDTGTGT